MVINHGSAPANSSVSIDYSNVKAGLTDNIQANPEYGLAAGLLYCAFCGTIGYVNVRVFNPAASAITVNRT